MPKAHYLITGGAGYIGSILTPLLTQQDAHVTVIDNCLSRSLPADTPQTTYINADIRHFDEIASYFQGVDGVVHLASLVGDNACAVSASTTWDINYIGTINVVNASKQARVPKFIFASTCSNYGISQPGQSANTSSPLYPQSIYAETKIRAEHYVLSQIDSNFAPLILRLSTIFGLSPRMRFDLAINLMTAHAFFTKQITVHGGTQWRPFIHVSDVAQIMTRALQLPPSPYPQIYNCGTNINNLRLIEVAELIADHIEGSQIIHEPGSIDHRDYMVDFSLMSEVFNYQCQYDVMDGIKEIKTALEAGLFENYTSRQFNNHRLTETFLCTPNSVIGKLNA